MCVVVGTWRSVRTNRRSVAKGRKRSQLELIVLGITLEKRVSPMVLDLKPESAAIQRYRLLYM